MSLRGAEESISPQPLNSNTLYMYPSLTDYYCFLHCAAVVFWLLSPGCCCPLCAAVGSLLLWSPHSPGCCCSCLLCAAVVSWLPCPGCCLLCAGVVSCCARATGLLAAIVSCVLMLSPGCRRFPDCCLLCATLPWSLAVASRLLLSPVCCCCLLVAVSLLLVQ